MPETAREVESAVRRLRGALVGSTIARAHVAAPGARAPDLAGAPALAARRARRRGGASRQASARPPRRWSRAARALPDDRRLDARSRRRRAPSFRARRAHRFDDGTRVVLDDPRALSTLELHRRRRRPGSRARPRAGRSVADGALAARRAVNAARPDQAAAPRSARHRRTRQHLRGGGALACADLAAGARRRRSRERDVARLLAAIRKVIGERPARATPIRRCRDSRCMIGRGSHVVAAARRSSALRRPVARPISVRTAKHRLLLDGRRNEARGAVGRPLALLRTPRDRLRNSRSSSSRASHGRVFAFGGVIAFNAHWTLRWWPLGTRPAPRRRIRRMGDRRP